MRKPSPEKPAINAVEAARISGLSRRMILYYVERGVLRGYRKGLGPTSTTMIYIESFEQFLQARKIQPPKE